MMDEIRGTLSELRYRFFHIKETDQDNTLPDVMR